MFVRWKRTRRFGMFEEQFPEAIALMARALRAGHAFPTGIQMVADEIPAPVGAEFKLLYDRQNFGMPLGDALKGMAERVPILDARFFTTAVLTQRETGGNLSEILDNLATVIRDRFKVKRQVRAVTAHGRITGWILCGMPRGAGVDPQRGVTGAHEADDHRSARDQDACRRRHDAGDRLVDHPQAGQHSLLGVLDMALDLLVTLVAGFLAVALVAGYGTSSILAALSPERRRLRQLATAGGPGASVDDTFTLVDRVDPRFKNLPGIPKSPKEMGRLRRRLAMAGYTSPTAVVVYALANLVSPVLFGLVALAAVDVRSGWLLVLFAIAVGYLLPGMLLARKIERRKREIREGLPDALDLFIVCVEAGSGLDQAIVKASDELGISYPALAYELRLITTEIRAGKPRVEAFRNFAARTKVDDVQSLVTLLVQTDKFGTSLAQALRTHADTSRTKRRQNAEERAGKLGVKLVFPLVLFLFPALYIVILGPAVITFLRVFKH